MGLKVTPSFTGDTNQNVLSQSPPAGTPVPKGTSITLSFPPGSCVGPACYMHGDLAIQRMTIERSRVPQ
jgi:hypothetical protein